MLEMFNYLMYNEIVGGIFSMKNYINDLSSLSKSYIDSFIFTANSITSKFMSREEFSKLNAEEFADIYLDTLVVAMSKIEERAKTEKKENGFFKR